MGKPYDECALVQDSDLASSRPSRFVESSPRKEGFL
jgi:hypothetical protein